ncbi:hypothetical protein N7504_009106 [Penicillium tannophilum]|nr:hypothetical protein N7504_009106 [Penicillium tannophilum]
MLGLNLFVWFSIWGFATSVVRAQSQWHIDQVPNLLDRFEPIPSTDSASGRSKCCPKGTQFDGQRCVPGAYECPQGFDFQDPYCVSQTGPSCPKGSTLRDQMCFSDITPTCPKGSRFDGHNCVKGLPTCRRGFRVENKTCVSDKPATCQPPYRFENNNCITKLGPICDFDDMEHEDGECIGTKRPTCDPGTSEFDPKWNRCVSMTPPSCPEDSKLENGACVSKTHRKGKCHGFDHLDKSLGKCVSKSALSCGNGFYLDPTTHECTHKQSPICPRNAHLSLDAARNSARCCPHETIWNGKMCWKFARGHKCPDGFNLNDDKCEQSALQKPKCPLGSDLRGLVCVSQTRPECRDGYSLDKGLCVRDGKPTCLKHFHYDVVRGDCVSDEEVYCPKGSELRGHDCVILDIDPVCQFGFTFDGERCVSDTISPTCGTNEYLEDGNCVVLERPTCPPRTTFSTTGCVSTEFVPECKHGSFPDDRGQCVVEKITTCPDGTARKKSGCLVRGVPICEDGARYNDQIERCVSIKRPRCPQGYSQKNGGCQLDSEIQCEKGFTRDGDKCCKKAQCKHGFYYDNKLRRCVGTIRCPHPDDYPEDGVCVRGPPTCPKGYEIRNWRCVSTRIVCQEGTKYNEKTRSCEADIEDVECPPGTNFKNGCCSAPAPGDYCASATWCGPKSHPIGIGGSVTYAVWELNNTSHHFLPRSGEPHYQEIDAVESHEFERHYAMNEDSEAEEFEEVESAEIDEEGIDDENIDEEEAQEEVAEEWGEWEEDEDEIDESGEEFDVDKV